MITPGKFLYLMWFRPIGWVKSIHQQGIVKSWRIWKGKRNMISHINHFPQPHVLGTDPALSVCYLTGKAYWYQTLYCARSLQNNVEQPLHIELIDDGSLSKEHVAYFQRVFSNVRVQTQSDVMASLNKHLPESQYPQLRRWRKLHPLLKKLTDVFIGLDTPRLLLDSDMLFYSRPEFIIRWQDESSLPCCMEDVKRAYGYSEPLLNQLAEGPLPSRANIGILGLLPNHIDPRCLESWLTELIKTEGRQYNLVQGLCALIFAKHGVQVAPGEQYQVLDQAPEDWEPEQVLVHFVSASKPLYFMHAWKAIH